MRRDGELAVAEHVNARGQPYLALLKAEATAIDTRCEGHEFGVSLDDLRIVRPARGEISRRQVGSKLLSQRVLLAHAVTAGARRIVAAAVVPMDAEAFCGNLRSAGLPHPLAVVRIDLHRTVKGLHIGGALDVQPHPRGRVERHQAYRRALLDHRGGLHP